MAFLVSLQIPVAFSPPWLVSLDRPGLSVRRQLPLATSHNFDSKFGPLSSRGWFRITSQATEGNQESVESETQEDPSGEPETASQPAELSELGKEIKKAMEQRKAEKEGNLLSGVAEEIQEIEWPPFGKVLGTTGVVLGVIAGSSIVLLTVNAVLAELSDRVFAGKGIQDFFS